MKTTVFMIALAAALALRGETVQTPIKPADFNLP